MPIDLDQLQKIIDAATPEPWEQSLSFRGAVSGLAGPLEIGSDAWRYVGGRIVGESMRAEDRALVIAARNTMPALIAELRAAREVIEAYDLMPVVEGDHFPGLEAWWNEEVMPARMDYDHISGRS